MKKSLIVGVIAILALGGALTRLSYAESKSAEDRTLLLLESIRRKVSVRKALDEKGFVVPKDVILEITRYLANGDYLNLRGVNLNYYCYLSDPTVIKYAGNRTANGIKDREIWAHWKTFAHYNPKKLEKLLMVPDRNLFLEPEDQIDLMQYLDNKDLQEKLNGELVLQGDFYFDESEKNPETLRKLAAFKNLKGLFFTAYSDDLDPRPAVYSALSEAVSSMSDLVSFSIINRIFNSEAELEPILGNQQLQEQLKYLALGRYIRNLDSKIWGHLSKFKKLESLFVHLGSKDVENYVAFSEAISQLRTLRSLDIDTYHSSASGDAPGRGYSELAKAINVNRSCTSLSIGNHANDTFFRHFGDHISEENHIQKLVLIGATSSPEDHFINFLRKLKHLEHLVFITNGPLYKSGVLKMFDILMSNPSIKYLLVKDARFGAFLLFGGAEIPDNEKFSTDDKDVIAKVTELKKTHPDLKIDFSGDLNP